MIRWVLLTFPIGCRALGLAVCLWIGSMWAPLVYAAAESVTCPDGEKRLLLDIKELAIQYEGHTWPGTLSSLSVLGVQLDKRRRNFKKQRQPRNNGTSS